MRVFFEARCCGRRLECNRVTRGHSLPCQPENRESLPPQPLRPTSESQCPVPWASHSPPLGSSWKAPLSSSRGASGWRRWGEKGVAPPPGGQGSALLRWARPGCRALSVRSDASAADVQGLQPSALGDLPSNNKQKSGERLWLLRAGSWIPRERLEQPPEAWGEHLPSRRQL